MPCSNLLNLFLTRTHDLKAFNWVLSDWMDAGRIWCCMHVWWLIAQMVWMSKLLNLKCGVWNLITIILIYNYFQVIYKCFWTITRRACEIGYSMLDYVVTLEKIALSKPLFKLVVCSPYSSSESFISTPEIFKTQHLNLFDFTLLPA